MDGARKLDLFMGTSPPPSVMWELKVNFLSNIGVIDRGEVRRRHESSGEARASSLAH